MKRIIFSMLALSLLAVPSAACDKCKKAGQPTFLVPSSAGTAAMTLVPSSTYSVPMTYSMSYGVPAMANVVPMTVSSAPASYTLPTSDSFVTTFSAPQSVVAAQTFVPQYVLPQSVGTSNVVYYTPGAQATTLSDVQAQGLFTDFLIRSGIGLAKPVACEFCRSLNCGDGSGGSSSNSLKDLREILDAVGDLIKSVKGLEKSIKEDVSAVTPEASPNRNNASAQIALLMQMRDELRDLNKKSATSRIAEGGLAIQPR